MATTYVIEPDLRIRPQTGNGVIENRKSIHDCISISFDFSYRVAATRRQPSGSQTLKQSKAPAGGCFKDHLGSSHTHIYGFDLADIQNDRKVAATR